MQPQSVWFHHEKSHNTTIATLTALSLATAVVGGAFGLLSECSKFLLEGERADVFPASFRDF